ncbi:hypothetical protein FKM82_025683 [Ascaphus truei]
MSVVLTDGQKCEPPPAAGGLPGNKTISGNTILSLQLVHMCQLWGDTVGERNDAIYTIHRTPAPREQNTHSSAHRDTAGPVQVSKQRVEECLSPTSPRWGKSFFGGPKGVTSVRISLVHPSLGTHIPLSSPPPALTGARFDAGLPSACQCSHWHESAGHRHWSERGDSPPPPRLRTPATWN